MFGCVMPYKSFYYRPDIVSVNKLTIMEDSVIIEMRFNFPPKFIRKKIVYTVYPKIIMDNDTINLQPSQFYGIKTHADSNIVSFKYGGEFKHIDKFKFKDSQGKFKVYYENKASDFKGHELRLPRKTILTFERK